MGRSTPGPSRAPRARRARRARLAPVRHRPTAGPVPGCSPVHCQRPDRRQSCDEDASSVGRCQQGRKRTKSAWFPHGGPGRRRLRAPIGATPARRTRGDGTQTGRPAPRTILGRGRPADQCRSSPPDQYDAGMKFRGRLEGDETLLPRGQHEGERQACPGTAVADLPDHRQGCPEATPCSMSRSLTHRQWGRCGSNQRPTDHEDARPGPLRLLPAASPAVDHAVAAPVAVVTDSSRHESRHAAVVVGRPGHGRHDRAPTSRDITDGLVPIGPRAGQVSQPAAGQ
jgi:hypothetical protein